MRHAVFHPATESMGKPWKNHGKTMGKIPWIPLKTMEHGARAKFHGFHASMEQENCNSIPHESMESMEYKTIENHGKHRI